MKNARIILRSALLLAPLALLAGCSSTAQKGESLSAIRSNPTPGLNTEDQRYSDIHSEINIVHNDNIRKLNSDGLRFMLLDRPSRLSPYPSAR